MANKRKRLWTSIWQAGILALVGVLVVAVVLAIALPAAQLLGVVPPPTPKPGGTFLGSVSLLLTVATVTLTFASFLVALLAILGWQGIRTRVDAEVARAMKQEREYDLAQGRFNQGITFGVITQYLTRMRPDLGEVESRTFFLEDSISFFEEALGGLRDEELEPHALNALAYSLALRGHPEDAERAWSLVEDCENLCRRGKTHESFLLTKGAVLGAFASNLPRISESDILTLKQSITRAPVQESRRFREHEKQLVLRSLDKALEELGKTEPPPPKRGRLARLVAAWQALKGS